MNPILQKRWQLCYHIAEQIEGAFNLQNHAKYDVDKAAKVIEALFPMTYAEVEVKMEEAEKEVKESAERKGPGIGERLRTALGLGSEVHLLQVMKAAIERIENLARVKEAIQKSPYSVSMSLIGIINE